MDSEKKQQPATPSAAGGPATTCEIVRVQHCAGGPRYDPQYVAAAGVRPPASRARFVAASRRGSRRPRRGADRGTVRPAPGFRGRATDEGSDQAKPCILVRVMVS